MITGMLGINGFPEQAELEQIASNLQELDFWNPLSDLGDFQARQLIVLGLAMLAATLPNTAALAKASTQLHSNILAVVSYSLVIGFALFYSLFLSAGLSTYIYFYF
jgi:hypothetical protein